MPTTEAWRCFDRVNGTWNGESATYYSWNKERTQALADERGVTFIEAQLLATDSLALRKKIYYAERIKNA